MKKQKIIISILMTLFLVSCSKSPGKTGAKFKLSIGALVDLGASGAGGAMLWGRSDKGDMFGTVIQTSTPMQLELSNGTWTFWSVAWEGNSNIYNFQGVTRCAKSSATLNGTDAQVNINLTNSTCANADFSPSVSSNAGVYEFPKIAHYDCNKLSDHNGIGCGTNLGSKSTSRRLVMPSFKKSNGGPIVLEGSALVSACRTAGAAFTDESLPLGNGVVPVYTVLESFFSTNDCDVADPKGVRKAGYEFGLLATARLDTIKFVNEGSCNPTAIPMAQCQALGGTYSASCTMSAGAFDISQAACVANGGTYTASTTSKKFELITAIPDLELCSGVRTNISNISPHPFASGNGTVSAPYTICKETQLNAIGLNATTYDDSDFSLQADLDMNNTSVFGDQPIPSTCFATDPGANFIPIGGLHNNGCAEVAAINYTGTFNGNGHSVSNIRLKSKMNNLGFIRQGGAIRNLTLNNIEVEGVENVGAVSGAQASKLNNIQVNEGEIRGKNFVGGIAGRYSSSTEPVFNVHARKLLVKLESSVANAVAGGLVADNNSSPSLYFKQSSFEGMIRSSHSTDEMIGGFLGNATSGANIYIDESFSSGVILTSASNSKVGGFIGYGTGPATINDSYSRMSIGPSYVMPTYSSAYLGGMVGYTTGAATINNSYYYGSIMHPCRKASNVYCIVGTLQANSTASGSDKYGAVLSADWFTSLPTDATDLTTMESGAAKTALINSGKFKEVGSLLPRLSWESSVCSLPENNATVAVQSATRGSAANPVVLCNKEQWREIAINQTLNYVIEDNLALGDIVAADMPSNFSGSIKGKGFYVSGFKGDVPSATDGGLFKGNSGKIIDINFAAGYLQGTASNSVGVVGINNATGSLENNHFESVNILGTTLISQGVIAGLNNGKVFNSSINSYSEANATSTGLAVGSNGATGTVAVLRVDGEIKVTSSSSDLAVGGAAGLNNGIISEVETGLRIGNSINTNSLTRIGTLVGKNDGTIRDALVRSFARIDFNVSGPLNGQAIGRSGASSRGERIVVTNEMAVPTSFITNAKHFVGEDLASGSTGYENTFALEGSVFEINATPLIVSTCTPAAGGFDYVMNAIYNVDPNYPDGYYSMNPQSDKNPSARIVGTHTPATPLLSSGATDIRIACGVDGIQAGNSLYMIKSSTEFTHTGFTSLDPSEFPTMATFCSSSASATGNVNYKCNAGEFDIVEDKVDGIGFNRLVQTYRSMMINKIIPTDRPIWSIDDGYPRLLLVH